jgi:DNA-binding FadR family transcriptional regulator
MAAAILARDPKAADESMRVHLSRASEMAIARAAD